jgi:hypothetical protein
MTEQFVMLAEIGNWPFYWPIIGLAVLIGIALFLYEIVDRFLAQRRGELSNKLQWDAGYIERISKAFKSEETDDDQKIPTNDRAEARLEEQTKIEKMGMF